MRGASGGEAGVVSSPQHGSKALGRAQSLARELDLVQATVQRNVGIDNCSQACIQSARPLLVARNRERRAGLFKVGEVGVEQGR